MSASNPLIMHSILAIFSWIRADRNQLGDGGNDNPLGSSIQKL